MFEKNRLLKVIFLIVILMVLIMIIPHKIPNYQDDTDFPWNYVPTAKGERVDPWHGFVYPLVLKVVYDISGDWILAGRIISASAMCVSVVGIFYISGWTGLFLLVLSPIFWHCGFHLTNDALGWLFMVMSFWIWEYTKRQSVQKGLTLYMILSGLFAGLAFGTRYQMAIIVIIGLKELRRRWTFWIPVVSFGAIQIFLNLRHGTGLVGRNLENIFTKGTALRIDKLLINFSVYPVRALFDIWPLWGIIGIFGMVELVRRKSWDLLGIVAITLVFVSVSFYSYRFFLPVMLPLILGTQQWMERIDFHPFGFLETKNRLDRK